MVRAKSMPIITPKATRNQKQIQFQHGAIQLVPSVGSVGDSCDNALAETINGLYKAEVIWRQRSWPNASAVEMATLRWVDWFNNHRLFGPIGHIPPAEAEANYYAACENLDMVA